MVSRLKEINSFVESQSDDHGISAKAELKEEFPNLLKELIGWFDNPNESFTTNVGKNLSYHTNEILDLLDDLLLPTSENSLVKFAKQTARETQTQYYFPIEGLPKHIQNLFDKKNFDDLSNTYFTYLEYSLVYQIKSYETTKKLVLT